MFQSLFGSKARKAPAVAQRLGCEQLGDRIVPAVLVQEVYVNPPGSNDLGKEFIELSATSASDLDNRFLVALEGEEGGSLPNSAGIADQVVDLESYQSAYASYLANGGAARIVIARTGHSLSIGANDAFVITVNDFTLENGSMSVAVLQGDGTNTIAKGDDLDGGALGASDGTLDDFAIVDAVGFRENSGDFVYGTDVTPSSGQDPDLMYRDSDTGNWVAGEVPALTPTPGAPNP